MATAIQPTIRARAPRWSEFHRTHCGSVERLGLAVGGRAGAVFKASDVILCLYT